MVEDRVVEKEVGELEGERDDRGCVEIEEDGDDVKSRVDEMEGERDVEGDKVEKDEATDWLGDNEEEVLA